MTMLPGIAIPGVAMYVGKTLFAQIMDFAPQCRDFKRGRAGRFQYFPAIG